MMTTAGHQSRAHPVKKGRCNMCRTLRFSLFAGMMGGLAASLAQAAEERPQDMLAAQIRMQGFTCDKPLSATMDAKRSRRDHAVWILKCSNA
ncbi:MAG: hypothetical protein ACJ8EL_21845, partial [Rhizomicrobium sp.]